MEKNSLKRTLCGLKDYVSIGFDVDHCLVRYKLNEFLPLTYRVLAEYLVKDKGYPENLLKFEKKDKCFMHNGLIIDLKNGVIIKLGEEKHILRAYYGYQRLTQKEIEEIYGHSGRLSAFDPQKAKGPDFLACVSFMELTIPVIFAKLLELKLTESSELDYTDYYKILVECHSALRFNYSHYDEENYYPIDKFGYFFREIKANPDKYIIKQPKMAELLKKLKSKGKILFIASNSHYEHVNMVMEYAYGEDWMASFDYVIAKSQKPTFFSSTTTEFKPLDLNARNRAGTPTSTIKSGGYYLDGCAKLLEENIYKEKNITKSRFLFVGDNFYSDCLASQENRNWDAVCIMEDLDDLTYCEGFSNDTWGKFATDVLKCKIVQTFWYASMKNQVPKIVQSVDSAELVKFWEEKQASNSKCCI